MRRGHHIPKPFQRPSVTIAPSFEIHRTWQTIPTSTVQEGDIVAGHGLVTLVTHGIHVHVLFQSGAEITSDEVQAVKAFHPES